MSVTPSWQCWELASAVLSPVATDSWAGEKTQKAIEDSTVNSVSVVGGSGHSGILAHSIGDAACALLLDIIVVAHFCLCTQCLSSCQNSR